MRIGLIADEVPADWQKRLDGSELFLLGGGAQPADGVDVLLVQGTRADAVAELRAMRSRLPYAQPIIIASAARRPLLQRAVTLSPGLGEVWIVTPDEVTDALIARAAQISGQRRRHAALQKHKPSTPAQAPAIRRPVVTDTFLATVLQVAHVAVFSLDRDNNVLSVNPAAERLFHIDGEEAVGRPILEVIHPVFPGVAQALLAESHGRRPDVEFDLPDGRRRVFEIDVALVPNRADSLRVLVAHDITDSIRQRELLEEQASELEQQSEQVAEQAAQLEELLELRNAALEDVGRLLDARSRFYAAMNHEIRTPINAILGFNDLILAGVYGDLSKELRESIERSQRAAKHLLELVNDVLDLSKIEAGRLDIERAYHQLPHVVSELLQTIEPAIVESGSVIEYDFACDTPVYTDERRVRQILMNLLSNAAKFGMGKPITVRCAGDGEHVRIEVIDRGIGIEKEQLPLIFEEFVQLRERRQRGTGLGLAISQRLAELLGGKMEVQSEIGKGSTFSLILPLVKPD